MSVRHASVPDLTLYLRPGAVHRLHWGCGTVTPPGWINCDATAGAGVDLACDILEGLPLESRSLQYAVSMQALALVPYSNVEDVLWELWRVLEPKGWLRLGLPDLDAAVHAYLCGDREFFAVPDGTTSTLSGKLVGQMFAGDRPRILFSYEFIEELLRKSGFREVHYCRFRQTCSPHAEIIDLDQQEHGSLFVEAMR